MSGDLSKTDLYEGVKTLVESQDEKLNLPQQKLFTLFSISFQYFLFQSTKKPGAYIIRLEDGVLADKLARKSKDPSTRKFLQSLLVPRKLKYDRSVFYLDYFNPTSWNITNDIPKDKIKGAILVKNTQARPMMEIIEGEDEEVLKSISPDQHLKLLADFAPKLITIGFDETPEGAHDILFPFIKKEKERLSSGVKINEDIDWGEDE